MIKTVFHIITRSFAHLACCTNKSLVGYKQGPIATSKAGLLNAVERASSNSGCWKRDWWCFGFLTGFDCGFDAGL